jgi:hypothetical protein
LQHVRNLLLRQPETWREAAKPDRIAQCRGNLGCHGLVVTNLDV